MWADFCCFFSPWSSSVRAGEKSLHYFCDSSVPFLPREHWTVTWLCFLCFVKQDVQRKGKDQQLKRDGLALRSVRGLREGRQLFMTTFCLQKHSLPLFFSFHLHFCFCFCPPWSFTDYHQACEHKYCIDMNDKCQWVPWVWMLDCLFLKQGRVNVAMQGLRAGYRFISTRSKPPPGEFKALCLRRCFFPVCAVLFYWCCLFSWFKHSGSKTVGCLCLVLKFWSFEHPNPPQCEQHTFLFSWNVVQSSFCRWRCILFYFQKPFTTLCAHKNLGFFLSPCVLHLNILLIKNILVQKWMKHLLLVKYTNRKQWNQSSFSNSGLLECLLTRFSLFSFSHATAPRCDPVSTDPCVSEEWGQQHNSGAKQSSLKSGATSSLSVC